MNKLIALALMSLACGAPEGRGKPFGAGMTFTPSEEIRAYAEAGLTRWTRATGVAFQTGEGGVTIDYVDQAYNDGEPVCGVTSYSYVGDRITGVHSIEVSRDMEGCEYPHVILLHELAHAIAPESTHAETGLYALDGGGSSRIDAEALTQVCQFLPCSIFNPE